MKIINLTPHEIHEVETGKTFPPSGDVARVSVQDTPRSKIMGMQTYTQKTGNVTGLPEPEDDTYYIVSAMVRLATLDRVDLLSPGKLQRDVAGQPTGCQGFYTNEVASK